MNNRYNIPVWRKCMLTVEEAAEYANIGYNKMDEMSRQPNCPFSLYIGRKKLIKREKLEEYLLSQVEL